MRERRDPRLRRSVWMCSLALALACARQEAPTGGDQDRSPPVVVSVTPEPLSRVEDLGTGIRLEFSERISERPTAGLMNDAVILSPRTEGVRVRHGSDALEVELPGGLRAGVVYRLTVLPVIRDLFGNTMREPYELAFSTGAELYPNAVVGLVLDRVTGRPTRDVLVIATAQGEGAAPSPEHLARTDSGGIFTLRYLPPARYDLVGFLDRNRNAALDAVEVQGRGVLELGPADTAFANFTLLEPDTSAARITRVEVADRSLVRLTFADYLEPDSSLARIPASVTRVDRQGGVLEVRQLLHEHRHVELRSQPAPPADTSAGAPPRAQAAPVGFVGRAQGADSVSLALLGLTLPSRVLYAELSDTLDFSVDYVLRIQGLVNLAGIPAGVDTLRFSRGAPPTPPRGPSR